MPNCGYCGYNNMTFIPEEGKGLDWSLENVDHKKSEEQRCSSCEKRLPTTIKSDEQNQSPMGKIRTSKAPTSKTPVRKPFAGRGGTPPAGGAAASSPPPRRASKKSPMRDPTRVSIGGCLTIEAAASRASTHRSATDDTSTHRSATDGASTPRSATIEAPVDGPPAKDA